MPLGQCLIVATLAGAAAGVVGGISLALAAATAIALAAIAVPAPRSVRTAALVAALGCAAAADGAWARERALTSPLGDWFDRHAPAARADEPVTITGRLVDDAAVADQAVRLVIDVETVGAGGLWSPAPGRLQAHVSGDLAAQLAPRWTAGCRIHAPVLLRRADVLVNPGGPSESWQILRRSFDLLGTVKSGSLVTILDRGSWLDRVGAAVRAHVRATAARYVAPHSEQSAAIVVAILIGDRVGLSDDVQRHLQAAGTYHVIAISGGNVALLTALCVFTLRFVFRSARLAALTTIAVVVAYGWVVGGGASVNRAVAGASLYLLVSLLGLLPSAVNVLGVVAMVLALIDPLTTIDVSAWLSFGASLSIVLGARRFEEWVSARWIPRPVVVLLAATVCAELALAPVSAAVFGRVGIAGLALNFIAIPAMSVVEIAGIIATALSTFWSFGAHVAGAISSVAATILVSTSNVVDTPSAVSWRIPPVSIVWTVVYYAGIATFLWQRRRRARFIAGTVTAASLAIILTAPGLELAGPPPGWLRVTILDVGQGDSILAQFPTRQSLLVDGGGAGSFDIGGRVVTPALWSSGVRHLDYLAFTHPDFDHIGGVRSVARDLTPREIWEGAPVPRNAARQALWVEAQRQGLAWRQLSAGHVLTLGSVELDVINPPLPDWERQRTRNEDSLVFRVRFGGVEMLLTGDAGAEFEARPDSGRQDAPLRLLKVGHHGSRSSSTPAFVSAFAPQLAFISVGRSNLFGHPAPDVLARYEAIGATIFRTDRDGAIVIETDGRDVRVRTMRGRSWTIMTRGQ